MDIGGKYDEIADALLETAKALESFISENMPTDTKVDRVQARAKARDRFLQKSDKIDAGKKKYDHPFSDIQDLIAARIVVLYLPEVDRVSKELSKLLTKIEVSEKEPEGFSEFGYFGWHAIMRIPEEANRGAQFDVFPKFFELQVKTIFQHAWAEAEHDLAYKQFSGSLDRNERRLIAYAAAQAWGADNSFAVVLEGLGKRK